MPKHSPDAVSCKDFAGEKLKLYAEKMAQSRVRADKFFFPNPGRLLRNDIGRHDVQGFELRHDFLRRRLKAALNRRTAFSRRPVSNRLDNAAGLVRSIFQADDAVAGDTPRGAPFTRNRAWMSKANDALAYANGRGGKDANRDTRNLLDTDVFANGGFQHYSSFYAVRELIFQKINIKIEHRFAITKEEWGQFIELFSFPLYYAEYYLFLLQNRRCKKIISLPGLSSAFGHDLIRHPARIVPKPLFNHPSVKTVSRANSFS